MSNQPPETGLQFARQNRVRQAADVAQEAISKVMRQLEKDTSVVSLPHRMLEQKVAKGRGRHKTALDIVDPYDDFLPFTFDIDMHEKQNLTGE